MKWHKGYVIYDNIQCSCDYTDDEGTVINETGDCAIT